MKKLAYLLLFAISLSLLGQEKIIIQSLNPDANLDSLQSDKYDKRYGLPQQKNNSYSLPSPELLDQILNEVELGPETSSMDQLDKDMLARKAKKYSIYRLRKSYPDLDENKLKKLKERLNTDQ